MQYSGLTTKSTKLSGNPTSSLAISISNAVDGCWLVSLFIGMVFIRIIPL